MKESEISVKEQEIRELEQRIIKTGKATLENASSTDISEASFFFVDMVACAKWYLETLYKFGALHIYVGNTQADEPIEWKGIWAGGIILLTLIYFDVLTI